MTTSATLSISRRGFARGLAAFAAVFVLTTAGPTSTGATEAGDPVEFVREFSEEAIAVVADKGLSGDARKQAFRRLLAKGFDIKTIGRFVLGRYWRKATEAERAEYVRLFEDTIVATYSRQLSSYAGEALKVGGVRQQDDKSALVASRILRQKGEPIQLDWRMLRRGDTWRIVDIVVEGMSMAVSQRSEFAAVIKGGGGRVEALLVKLREKTQQANSGAAKNGKNTL